MGKPEITEEMIFGCFAAAQEADSLEGTAASFVDVEEYENKIMYPEFARWAKKVNRPDIARIFARVAGEEGLHAHWLRELYADMGTPERGEDTERAIEVLPAHMTPDGAAGTPNESVPWISLESITNTIGQRGAGADQE